MLYTRDVRASYNDLPLEKKINASIRSHNYFNFKCYGVKFIVSDSKKKKKRRKRRDRHSVKG